MNQTRQKSTGKLKYDPVRGAALQAMVQIEQGAQTDDAVKEVVTGRGFQPLDIRFLLQLVNGATKMRRRLDHEIKFHLARPSVPLSMKLQNILRLGFYQLLFTDRVPAAAAVSESVNLARKFTDLSQSRLVNAVMRSKLREPEKVKFASRENEPEKFLADFYSFPIYFVRYCLEEFGLQATKQMLLAFNKPPTVTYRVNYLKAKPEEVCALLDEHGIEYEIGKYLPEFVHINSAGLPLEAELLESGKVFVQDESAGLPVRLLNPRPGSTVVDLTAAPGGKATYAAVRMRNKGRVTAVDRSRKRLERVVENAQRLGIKIIAPVAADMADFTEGEYDRVMLDPPCSGWGTAGKHSDLRWSKTRQDITNMAKIQAKMIDRASRLVKPGGVMVYSTCTIIREENDQIVEEFLARNDKFELESAEEYFDQELVNARGFVKTYPNIENMGGAFCARLRRKTAD